MLFPLLVVLFMLGTCACSTADARAAPYSNDVG
uniref:Uncharacterized protein n=1 Tax=Picea glauca TaxID=3330 RepID=A0A101LZM8_PICGL|nr:hypothetical protein ABT39_MTgene5314 [Picea glauca]